MNFKKRLLNENFKNPEKPANWKYFYNRTIDSKEYPEFSKRLKKSLKDSVSEFLKFGLSPEDEEFISNVEIPTPKWVQEYFQHIVWTLLKQGINFDLSQLEKMIEEIYLNIATNPLTHGLESIQYFLNRKLAEFKELHNINEKRPKVAPSERRPDSKFDEFGEYVFSPQREDVPDEKNTPLEDQVWNDLSRHVGNNYPMKDTSTFALMQALEDDAYPNVFHGPDVEYVFRGLTVKREMLEKLIGEKAIDNTLPNYRFRTITVRPREGNSTSWSTSWPTAVSFSKLSSIDNVDHLWRVVLIARPSDNPDTFLEGENGGFYKIPDLEPYSQEKECIALGSVKLYAISWSGPGRESKMHSSFSPERLQADVNESLMKLFIKELLITLR